ncbi:MAG: DUF4411 family protein [Chloroflexi bacterium]|nr:DUF4411 family protein [Chloroflexota bacterium]
MIYVFDSSTLIDLFRYYYPSRFPSLWDKFAEAVTTQTIISVREVKNEIGQRDDRLSQWMKQQRDFFQPPDTEELRFVAEIFAVPHFQMLVRKQERLQGKPVADPFVIAKAKIIQGCVVTEETFKPNGARIPNVCQHFGVDCLSLEGFMERENWTF